MNEVDDFLEHFGVKGMQWGVKKAMKPVAGSLHRGLSKRNETLKKKRDAKNPSGSPANRAQLHRQLAGRAAIAGLTGAAAVATVAIGVRYAQDARRDRLYNSLLHSALNNMGQTRNGRSHVIDVLSR